MIKECGCCGSDASAVAIRHGECGARGGPAAGREEDAQAQGAGRAGGGWRVAGREAAVRVQRRGRALGPAHRAPPPHAALRAARGRVSPLHMRGLSRYSALALRRR